MAGVELLQIIYCSTDHWFLHKHCSVLIPLSHNHPPPPNKQKIYIKNEVIIIETLRNSAPFW